MKDGQWMKNWHSQEPGMNTLDMISKPLMFIEDLREHTRKVCEAVELAPALMTALLAADDERARRLHGQMSQVRNEAERLKHSLYEQFKDIHFRNSGEYAVGQYIAGLDKVVESAEAFADLVTTCRAPVPVELHANLEALAAQVSRVAEQLLGLAETIWPPEETMPSRPNPRDMIDAIDGVTETHSQTMELVRKLSRQVYGLETQLDPAALAHLTRCCVLLSAIAGDAELAADHLRMIIR
jgi:uncharacterized protein Yka (UPF0111/DUF47 family)